MKGAIFFSSKYGSTAQYAHWIGEATGLPVFDIKDSNEDPSKYDFLILGSALIFYRLIIRKWVKANLVDLMDRSKILFTVSGAGAGAKLNRWIAASLPETLLSKMDHVVLRGRMDPTKLNWTLRQIMRIGALLNPDPQASKEEREGFDYVDKASIEPIIKLIQRYQAIKETT
ncbi:flavodoxin domain-containing protein [Maribacter sp. CXY002]|uniref:flavodoxin domain-containing protein n=1 Tax=Maribacter luteocoastalis TaxID=3407671 RepID=UPI003B670739